MEITGVMRKAGSKTRPAMRMTPVAFWAAIFV